MAIARWTWIVANKEYPLDDGTHSYFLGDAGAGLVPFHRLEERGPVQDGSTDRGFKLDPRIMILSIVVAVDSWEEYDVKRRSLIRAFKPLNFPGRLRWSRNGDVREISGFPIDGLSMDSSDREGFHHRQVVAIKCNDPAWYNPEAQSLTFALGSSATGMPVPTDVPTVIGAERVSDTQVIEYRGDLPSYPVLIRITGPIVNPVIYNYSIGEKLDFTGTTINAGEWFDIMLQDQDRKVVIDQAGVNKYHLLSADSSISSWRIEADPTVPDGLNIVAFTGTGTTAATSVDLTYFERYASN